jgi:hypothetical protein
VKYLQQGDVLMFPTEIPKEAKRISTNVLQEGEHTGHAHRLQFRHDDKAIGSGVYQHPTSLQKFFKLEEPTLLRHEEHHEILVPPGEYEIRIVREYDHFAEEARSVID